MLPPIVQVSHAFWVPNGPFFAHLHDAVKCLGFTGNRIISKCVEGIVDSINEQPDTNIIIITINERRIQEPHIETQLGRVCKLKDLLGDPLHNVAPSIVLNGVFSITSTHEHTLVVTMPAHLPTTMCAPPIEHCVYQCSLYSRRNLLGQLHKSPMNLWTEFPRGGQ